MHRNDRITSAASIAADPDAIVLSPGPCTPKEAGICLDLMPAAAGGYRCSASASAIRRSATPSAAKWCARRSRCTASCRKSATMATGIFRGINGPFQATRYHSLVVDRAEPAGRTRPSPRKPRTGWSWGLPTRGCRCTACNSIPKASPRTTAICMLKNFLDLAAAWNVSSGRRMPRGARRAGARELRARRDRDFKALIGKVATGAALSRDEAAGAFEQMMSGEATPSQMGALSDGACACAARPSTRSPARSPPCARRCCASTRRPMRSTSSAPAATPRARSISRPARR